MTRTKSMHPVYVAVQRECGYGPPKCGKCTRGNIYEVEFNCLVCGCRNVWPSPIRETITRNGLGKIWSPIEQWTYLNYILSERPPMQEGMCHNERYRR